MVEGVFGIEISHVAVEHGHVQERENACRLPEGDLAIGY
jgi:hypothetical protein